MGPPGGRLAWGCCSLKVGVRNLDVVTRGNGDCVADPLADGGNGIFPGQVGFATCPQVVPEPGPLFQSGTSDDLLKRRPELRNNRVEAARLCQLRASLYDLALGASPGYMEEAAPVPPALIRFAGEVNGLFGVNRSFAVMLPNRSNIDDAKSVSAWMDAGSFRLAAFNDSPVSGKFEVRLDREYFEGQHWTLKDFQGARVLTVSPEGEKAASVQTSNDGKFITLHFELPGFSALLLSCDKTK